VFAAYGVRGIRFARRLVCAAAARAAAARAYFSSFWDKDWAE